MAYIANPHYQEQEQEFGRWNAFRQPFYPFIEGDRIRSEPKEQEESINKKLLLLEDLS